MPSLPLAQLHTATAGGCPISSNLRLSVVVPIYNERATLSEIVRRVRSVPIPKDIILVDDASTDGTRDLLARLEWDPDLTIAYHVTNRGKGAALRTGFRLVTGDVVLVQDADMEYNPDEFGRLIQPIVEGSADVVYGSRFAEGRKWSWHTLVNRFLTSYSNRLTGLRLTDMETCYKVFRREVLEAILPTLKEDRFGFEPEFTAKVARRKYRVRELPICYAGRSYKAGKKIKPRDGLAALWCIVRYWKWD